MQNGVRAPRQVEWDWNRCMQRHRNIALLIFCKHIVRISTHHHHIQTCTYVFIRQGSVRMCARTVYWMTTNGANAANSIHKQSLFMFPMPCSTAYSCQRCVRDTVALNKTWLLDWWLCYGSAICLLDDFCSSSHKYLLFDELIEKRITKNWFIRKIKK